VAGGARIIGINNRDLKSFHTDLGVTERIAPQLPKGNIIVGESGIHTVADAQRMAAAGVDSILVGESLILRQDRAEAVRNLASVRRA
jgi:indole-3-glycerol phosphate synthase